MSAQFRWRRPWKYAAGAACLAVAAFGVGNRLGALQLQAATTAPDAAEAAQAEPPFAAADPDLESPADSVVLAQKKRIMGRLRSLEMVRRVTSSVRPLVDRAIEQPSVQADLRYLASRAGMPLAQYKAYFCGKQEADLLLESGGDPDARSVSNAIGVAQWLASTGSRRGLKVNLSASNALSRQIAAVDRQIDSLAALPVDWTKPVPPGLRGVIPALPPDSDGDASMLPVTASAGEGAWTRDQWLAYRKSQRRNLVMKRRQVDERYDPAKAIAAQTRYLVELTRRYGGVDWALQAYHGGEGGASRTMRLFASGAPSRALMASRSGGYQLGGSGRWLPYGELYRSVSPTSTPAAFGYLFGRSDDHRYYWWKVLMAERALNLYRNNPKEFEKEWRALQPGLSSDAMWYPDPTPLQYADSAALRAAYLSGELVALPRNAPALGLRTENLAALEPASAGLHKGLRPEAMGGLLRLASLYRNSGGGEPIVVLAMVQSNEYRRKWNSRYPPGPLPPDVPRDPEFHTMGLTFDLKRPTRDWDRKVLEYSLGRLYDTLRISWRPETEAGSRRYHVVVNPAYRSEMVGYYERFSGRRTVSR